MQQIKSLVVTTPFLNSERPPISGATICAVLEGCGHKVTAWDANIKFYKHIGANNFFNLQNKFIGITDVHKDDFEIVKNFLSLYNFKNYDYICVSVFSRWSLQWAEILLEHIKNVNPFAKIIVGGSGVTTKHNKQAFGEYALKHELCHYYIQGEGEVALKELINGNTTYAGINGRDPIQLTNLDNLPLPNYAYYNLEDYDYAGEGGKNLSIYGSRGCVRNCSFCNVPVYWPKFRWRTGEHIAEELIKHYENYGVTNFYFTDSLVNGNLKEYKKLHETLAKKNLPKFHIAGYAIIRPKHQHSAEFFDMLAHNGTHFWSVGVEHGADAPRLDMGKKFTNSDIDWHLEQSYRIGLQNNFLMLPTWVTETYQDHIEYMETFPRWQKYVATGTISAFYIAEFVMALKGTPLLGQDYELQMYDGEQDIDEEIFWMNLKNKNLTFNERFRRTIAIHEQAVKYKYPVTNLFNRLQTLISTIEKYNKNKFEIDNFFNN